MDTTDADHLEVVKKDRMRIEKQIAADSAYLEWEEKTRKDIARKRKEEAANDKRIVAEVEEAKRIIAEKHVTLKKEIAQKRREAKSHPWMPKARTPAKNKDKDKKKKKKDKDKKGGSAFSKLADKLKKSPYTKTTNKKGGDSKSWSVQKDDV